MNRQRLLTDPESFADELRTIADRIEDGEYELSQLSIGRPSQDGCVPGRFEIEYYTIEEARRMHQIYETQLDRGEE